MKKNNIIKLFISMLIGLAIYRTIEPLFKFIDGFLNNFNKILNIAIIVVVISIVAYFAYLIVKSINNKLNNNDFGE